MALLVALFASSFKDGPSWSLTHRIWHGPLAGIAMSNERASQIAAVEAQGRRWVRPADRVLVFNAPGAYLLVGGRAYTNAVWLHFGPGDGNTVTYYVKRGHHPNIQLVSRSIVASSGGTTLARAKDPRSFPEEQLPRG